MDPHQTSIYTAVLISSFILGLIILYFTVSIIRHQRRSHAFYKLSLEAEINTLERERSRMAADLHDEVGPLLSAIKFNVGSLDIASPEDEETVEKTNVLIDNMVQRMRQISNDLMPNILVHKGLVSAILDSIEKISKPSSLDIRFTYQDIPELSSFTSIHIYRMVLEIIHNTVKHAHATELKIDFKKINGLLVLHTMDNGAGFDYKHASKETGRLGLHNLLSRAEMLSAKLYADTDRGKGTVYIIEIPFNP
jgi:two-component system, NarL family, sensor kinase